MCCHPRFILWSCGDVQQRDVRQSGAQKEIGPDTTGNVNVVGALDSLEEGSLRERAVRRPSQSVFAKSGRTCFCFEFGSERMWRETFRCTVTQQWSLIGSLTSVFRTRSCQSQAKRSITERLQPSVEKRIGCSINCESPKSVMSSLNLDPAGFGFGQLLSHSGCFAFTSLHFHFHVFIYPGL